MAQTENGVFRGALQFTVRFSNSDVGEGLDPPENLQVMITFLVTKSYYLSQNYY